MSYTHGGADRWHARMLPINATEQRALAQEFLWITGWALSPQEAEELLRPWIERGWPLKAILHGIDHTYSGEPQRSHRGEKFSDSFDRRMKNWIDGFGKRRPSPIEPIDRDDLAARERQRWHDEIGYRRQATARSASDRDAVRRIASEGVKRARRDRVEMMRETAERTRRAMRSLGPGPALVEPEEVFANEISNIDSLQNSLAHRSAMRVSGLDQESAETLAELNSPARQVLSNKYRRYRHARASSRLDEMIPPQDE